MSTKPVPVASSTTSIQASTTTPKKSWPKRFFRIGLVLVLVLGMLVLGIVLALPRALPWFIQQQGIAFHWENPEWKHNGFSVSQVQLTLPGDDAHPKQLLVENLRINWAWHTFPIQVLKAKRLQIDWPIVENQTQDDQSILAIPAAILKWLPQQVEIQEIDAKLPGVGHLQGSLNLQANAQGRLWQPAMVSSQLTLKKLQGAWLDSIPTQFRPQQLSVQISTHPDHQENTGGRQLLSIKAHSEGPARILLMGSLDLQPSPQWQGTLKEGELVVQLNSLAHPYLQAEQLQAHINFIANADAERFTVSLNEHSSLAVNKLQSPNLGFAEQAMLELAGISLQGHSTSPYDIEVHGPISLHLEDLNAKQLHQQNWDLTGALKGMLSKLEFTGNLTGQHGLGFDSQIHLLDETIQGRVTLKEVVFNASNPLEKTFKAWPAQVSLDSGLLQGQLDFDLTTNDTFKASVNSSANKLSGYIDKGKLSNLDLEFNGQIELQPSHDWQGTLKDGQILIQLDKFVHPSVQAEHLKASTYFTGNNKADQFTLSVVKPTKFEVSKLLVSDIGRAEKLTIQLPTLSVESNTKAPYKIAINSKFNTHLEQLSAEQLHTQNWDINGDLSGQLPQLKLNGNLTGQNGLVFDSKISLLENSVEGSATVKEIFFKAGNPLHKTFKNWPELLSFNNGQLQSKISFSLPNAGPFKLSFSGNAKGLNGIINRSELTNMNAQFNGQLSKQTIKIGIPTLTVGQLNPGIPLESFQLTNAHYNANLKTPLKGVLDWQNVQANVLKGRAWLDAQKLDLKRAQKLLVYVEGLELQELFKVYPAEGLAGTGIIDGQLPIHIDGDAVYIDAGQLQARKPGVLQFHSDKIKALGEKNQAMRLVADALEDFHFNLLHSTLNYDQSGKLVLNIRLEGQNPDIEKGRPIHLNINLEENIPALLASIQLSGKVSEIIQKRVRERLEKR